MNINIFNLFSHLLLNSNDCVNKLMLKLAYIFRMKTQINKKKLTPYEISKINNLKKRKNSIKKLCKKSVNGISKDDEKMLATIDKTISNLEYDTSITRHDISLSDDIIKIIDSLIDLFSMEYMYKDIIIQKKIEIINIDKIIKYVSENTFKALNPRIFETESVYSKDFLIDYIAKKSKVFVMTYVMKYNIEISLK